ncbi:ATP-binding protein [Streptomyces roseirectus]|uniref:ATP-binding protein n=1 Tax=Streptomyces roseirectus TaxID=2768066 RepID=A0A7H0IIU3_9ACTN|nr:ATP-binding protein [Streptomyces roseirectus]QNP72709.1 ATP-binding protein [Streptomyces roseirectus]
MTTPAPTPTTPHTESWNMSYPMTLRSVPLARRQTLRRLTLWSWPGNTYDATLIVSELVANAIRHAHRPGHELWLHLALLENPTNTLLIEVSDPTTTFPTLPAHPTPEAGRGLQVVNSLTTHLDWHLRPHIGKTVATHLPCAPAPR